MNRRFLKIGLALLVIALVALAGWRILQSQRAQSAAMATPPAPVVLELPADDILTVRTLELTRAVEFSGSVRAVQSAFVKARVAAEIQSLTVREGDSVRAGQVLVQQDPTEFDWRLRQAEQQAQSARAQLEITQRSLANNRALVAQGFISPTALESSVSNEAAAQANLQATLAAVEIARKARGDTSLAAPMNGVIAQRLVQPGERVGVDARLLEIVDLSRLEVEAALAPQDVARLRVGQAARVTVDGIDSEIGARVSRINPSALSGSRTVQVYLALDANPALRQGLFARGRIELERTRTLALPRSAVRVDRAEPYVLLLQAETVRAQRVRLGGAGLSAAGGPGAAIDAIEILQGVSEGQRVLAGAVGAVAEGTRWKPARAAAASMTTAQPSAATASAPGR
ncbi:MAG: efflux RND transporter periplasmic adaptor subunit [Rubrivivax sp.]|nr:efflux RND transporter periplasmic adaptor subunit [Rubrivivax sp.]